MSITTPEANTLFRELFLSRFNFFNLPHYYLDQLAALERLPADQMHVQRSDTSTLLCPVFPESEHLTDGPWLDIQR
jgi:hypothetical protein